MFLVREALVNHHRRNMSNIRMIAGRRAARGIPDVDFLESGNVPVAYRVPAAGGRTDDSDSDETEVQAGDCQRQQSMQEGSTED